MTPNGHLTIYDGTSVPGFQPGNTPLLAYGSTWTRGSFTCVSATTGVTCYSNSTKHGFTIDRNGVTRYPAPVQSSGGTSDYITADAMEAAFEENGIDVSGAHLTWLQVGCIGQGDQNGTALDRNGVSEPRYHLFECDGTLSNNKTALVHTQIYTSPGQPDRFQYRSQIINVF